MSERERGCGEEWEKDWFVHQHHVVPLARISLTLSRHFSLSFIASGRSSGLHPVSSQSCCMYVRAGLPAFAWPYAGVHSSTSLMSSSLLLQQCPACLIRLTCIVFVMGGNWLFLTAYQTIQYYFMPRGEGSHSYFQSFRIARTHHHHHHHHHVVRTNITFSLFIVVVINRQTVSFYQNSCVARHVGRSKPGSKPANFTLDLVSDRSNMRYNPYFNGS